MNPPNSNNNSGMLYSKSTSALHNRLRPQNDNIALAPKGLNTTQPKSVVGTSNSTPHLAETTQGTLKVSKLRSDANANNAFHKTLSNAPSAVLLSPNAHVRSHFSEVMTNSHNYTSRSEFSRAAPRPEIEASKYENDQPLLDDNGQPIILDTDTKISVHKNSFIGSLNLTQKQLLDLYKVPQTFFYLRIRLPGSPDLHATNASDLRTANAGSVYDLELVSLDQVDKNNYFTLSKEGVTQFRNKVSSFTGLAQWEREFRLFHKIATINFFRIYKRWKVNRILTVF
jgi:hypothetical protein